MPQIPMTLKFSRKEVLVKWPAIPPEGSIVHFMCSDQKMHLKGRVRSIEMADDNGEVLIVVHVQRL